MLIDFTKMHALGNDFVIIDNLTQFLKMSQAVIKRIADRHLGIGCDQVLIIESPIEPENDFFVKIFNQDGSEAKNCINGLRCVARYLWDNKLFYKQPILLQTIGGVLKLGINPENKKLITATYNISGHTVKINEKIIDNLKFFLLELGNPHAVLIDNNKNPSSVDNLANLISREFTHFNVSVVQIISQEEVNLHVFERGVGPTLSCGSAAMAAGIVCQQKNKLNNKIKINFQFGSLSYELNPRNNQITIIGPTNRLFSGKIRV